MEIFVLAISLVCTVFSIMLYIKIWQMTDDVKKLVQLVGEIAYSKRDQVSSEKTNHYCPPQPTLSNESSNQNKKGCNGKSETVPVDDLKNVGGFKIGDTVKLLSNGNLFIVVGLVDDKLIQCKSRNKGLLEVVFDKIYEFEPNQIVKTSAV